MKLQPKPVTVNAVQYDGQHPTKADPGGIAYVTEVVGASMVKLSGHGLRVRVGEGWVPVAEGDYIVAHPSDMRVVPEAVLHDEYEVVV